jgi:4-hydroxybenzoate polyprenyltransferase
MGVAGALWLSRLTHLGSLAFMIAVGWSAPQFGAIYFAGVGCAALLLVVEHALVSADDLSRANVAFFTLNGIISVLVGALGIMDVFI